MLAVFLVVGCGAKKNKILESKGSVGSGETLTSLEEQSNIEQSYSRSEIGEGAIAGELLNEIEDEKSDNPLTLDGLAELEKDMESNDEETERLLALKKEVVDDGFKNVADLKSGHILPIYFGYDRCSFTDDVKKTLRNNAERLDTSSTQTIILEGHTDERGSQEYNLALGECRSKSVLNYLSDFGVTDKLSTVSFGEEKPVCSEHNESCWSQNRRVEFKIITE
jgi:peptidoglycan-associated lipoprotein